MLDQALEAKGYLPRPGIFALAGPMAARRRFRCDWTCQEIQEGNYLSSQNRLTLDPRRVDAELGRSNRSGRPRRERAVAVPLPNLPAYLASRVAVSPERSEEFERFSTRTRGTRSTRSFVLPSPTCRRALGTSSESDRGRAAWHGMDGS